MGLKEKAKDYYEKLNLDAQPTNEDLRKAVTAANKARAMIMYLIWKEMKAQYPEIDADNVMIKASEKFGIHNGKKWGNVTNAKEALYAQSSKAGYLTFQQELIEYTEDYAQKNFHYCPHVDAVKELGATPEEIKFFCQDILSAGDYGNMEPHDSVELEFKAQIGNGDDHCAYCVKKVK